MAQSKMLDNGVDFHTSNAVEAPTEVPFWLGKTGLSTNGPFFEQSAREIKLLHGSPVMVRAFTS
ncbi:MAG TPA: hypothetical protein VGG11_19955 [Xanthobacteraceae bacterium]